MVGKTSSEDGSENTVVLPATPDEVPVVTNTTPESSQTVPTPTPATEKPVVTPAPVVTPPPAPVPVTNKKDGYTPTEVASHNSKTSCWTIMDGKVYDLTPYVSRHPGGEKNILKICGVDGASLFESKHGGESKPENRLASLYIGALIQ